MIKQPFFNERSSLLVTVSPEASCSSNCHMSIENQIIARKAMYVAAGVFAFAFVGVISALNIIYFPDDWSTILGTAGFGLCGIGFLGIAVILLNSWRKWKTQMIAAYPHFAYLNDSYLSTLSRGIRFDYPGSIRYTKPIVEAAVDLLKQRGLLDVWLKIKNYATKEQAIAELWEKTKEGHCHGYSVTLLTLMKNGHNLSSKDLLSKIKYERVVFNQILHGMSIDFANSKPDEKEIILDKLPRNLRWETHQSPYFNISIDLSKTLSIDELNELIWLRFSILYYFSLHYELSLLNFNFDECCCHLSPNLSISKEASLDSYFDNGLDALMRQAQMMGIPLQNLIIAGMVVFWPPDSSVGHGIFFQYSENGRIRFHDNNPFMSGFFEFDDKKTFLKSIFDHVKSYYPAYSNGYLSFLFVGIPEEGFKVDLTLLSFQQPSSSVQLPIFSIQIQPSQPSDVAIDVVLTDSDSEDEV